MTLRELPVGKQFKFENNYGGYVWTKVGENYIQLDESTPVLGVDEQGLDVLVEVFPQPVAVLPGHD